MARSSEDDQKQKQISLLKKIDVVEEAYNPSEGNFAISHNATIDLFNKIKKTNKISIHPSNFTHLIKHIGIIDVQNILI